MKKTDDGSDADRSWTLDSAREILADVRAHTEKAVLAVEPLVERRQESSSEAEHKAIDLEVQQIVEAWGLAMEGLGLEVKGLWRVDFDTGSGLLCWQWPEERLEYFHGYDEGFAGRLRIQ
jgi:hypothetical protein